MIITLNKNETLADLRELIAEVIQTGELRIVSGNTEKRLFVDSVLHESQNQETRIFLVEE